MKTHLTYIFLLFIIKFSFSQTNYSWATYPTRCTGAAVYTQPNMSVNVTGTGFANYGPQCAASACAASGANRYFSPKYVTSPNASAPDWQYNGLALGVDWANTGSNATVVITFTTAVCGPVQFSIYDINSGTWGGYNPVWRDRVTISGTDNGGSPIYPTSIAGCANNTVSGANSNIISAGLNTGCTNGTHLITFNSPTVKTLTILYTSMGIDPTYGTDPDPEYIIISDIISTSCILPIETNEFAVDCDNHHTVMNWSTSNAEAIPSFEIMKSTNGKDYSLAGMVEGNKKGISAFSWRDPEESGKLYFYKLRSTDNEGNIRESKVVSSNENCLSNPGFSIYPNPAENTITLQAQFSESGDVRIEIYDLTGRMIKSLFEQRTCVSESSFSKVVDISMLQPGIYTVLFKAGNKIFHQKLIVE